MNVTVHVSVSCDGGTTEVLQGMVDRGRLKAAVLPAISAISAISDDVTRRCAFIRYTQLLQE